MVFFVVAGVCLWLIPKPHSQLDYMVAGAVATAVALATGFASLNWRGGKRRLTFMRKVPVLRIRYIRRSGSIE